jgi:cytochrome c oxidase subunit IV
MCVCVFFFGMKKGPIQGSVCFKLVVGFLVLGPLSKVALIMHKIWLKVIIVIALLSNS